MQSENLSGLASNTLPGSFPETSPVESSSSDFATTQTQVLSVDTTNVYLSRGPVSPHRSNPSTSHSPSYHVSPSPSRLPRAITTRSPKGASNGVVTPASGTRYGTLSSPSNKVNGHRTTPMSGTGQRNISSGSIQDRIRQIEQASAGVSPTPASGLPRRVPRTRTPSLSDRSDPRTSNELSRNMGSPIAARTKVLTKKPPPPKTSSERTLSTATSSAGKAEDLPVAAGLSPGRKPLFGEVLLGNDRDLAGHGIPSIYTKRSASESNIFSPTTSDGNMGFAAAASQSFDAALAAQAAARRQEAGDRDATEPQSSESTLSSRQLQPPIHHAQITPSDQDNRPPAAMSNARVVRRHSASAEHIPSTDDTQALADSVSPASKQRYVRSASRTPSSSHTVNAVIKEIPSTSPTSPRLRSSRPRVPVSAATTAASRARTQEPSPAHDSRSASPTSRPSSSRDRKPRTKSILKAAEEARAKSKSRTRKANYAATDSSESLPRPLSNDDSFMSDDAGGQRNVAAGITLNTAVAAPSSGLSSAITETEDDSPILGRTVYQPPVNSAGQDHDRMAPEVSVKTVLRSRAAPQTLSPIMASPDLSKQTRHVDPADTQISVPIIISRPPGAAEGGVLHQLAMQLKEDPSLEERHGSTLTSMFSGPDEGTINVALGQTPVLGSSSGAWEQTGPPILRFSTPNPEELNDTEITSTPISSYADDSISAILGPRSSQNESPAISMHDTPQQSFTLDSQSRDEINKILDFYNSHLISASQKQEFQEQVAAITPALAQDEETWNDGWAEPKATRLFLKKLLDDADENTRRTAQAENAPALIRKASVAASSSEAHTQPSSTLSNSYAHEGTPDSYQSPGMAFVQLGPRIPSKERVGSEHNYSANGSVVGAPVQGRGALGQGQARPAGLGLQGSSAAFPPKLPEVEGAGQGLGLALSDNNLQIFSDIAATGHSSTRSTAASSVTSAAPSYTQNAPPPLNLASPTRSTFGDASTQQNASSLRRSPETMRNKRRSRNLGSDGSFTSSRLSLGSPTQIPGFLESQQFGKSSDSGQDSITLADSAAPSVSTTTARLAAASTPTLAGTVTSENGKRLTTRRYIIRELVDTEHAYNQDMVILEDIYMGTAQGVLDKADLKILFGNLASVRGLSTRFLDSTKRACASIYVLPKASRWKSDNTSTASEPTTASAEITEQTFADKSEEEREALDRQTYVGKVFRDFVEELEHVYKDFLKNQSAAHARLHELQKEAPIKMWLDECSLSAKDLTSAWDLDSMLVKPLQRLTKYPLLLKQLKESTPTDHPDYENLDIAYSEMDLALQKINDKTRRQEVMQTLMRGPTTVVKEKERKKFPKLLAGKTSKMQQYVGTINVAEDREYDSIAQKFGGHFFQLQIVMRDVEKYCEDVAIYVGWYVNYITTLGELLDLKPLGSNADLSQIESKWIAFGQAIKSISQTGLERHVREVRSLVIEPIIQLWRLHEQPQKMMQKRKKRMPEYAKFRDMTEKGLKPDKRTQEVAEQFDAVNVTLKEELPQLYNLTRKLIENCLHQFVVLQARWQESWMKQIIRIDQSLEQQEPIESLLHDFREHYDLVLDEASRFSLLNGEARAALNFLSPSTTHSGNGEDSSFAKRPTGLNVRTTDQNFLSSPEQHATAHRHSGSFSGHSPVSNMFPTPAEQYQAGRTRTRSEVSSRGPSTPKTANTPGLPNSSNHPPLPANAAGIARPSAEEQYYLGARTPGGQTPGSRPRSGSYFYIPEPGYYGTMPLSPPSKPVTPGSATTSAVPNNVTSPISATAGPKQRLRDQRNNYPAELDALDRISARSRTGRAAAHQRGQSDFARDFYHGPALESEPNSASNRAKAYNSATPMEDGETRAGPSQEPEPDYSDLEVLFLAASLFEFRIDPNRMEAGYPYLRYAPGEVFDVVGVKGELWLARNQDDARRTIGWIWEKHFARILDA